MMRWVVGTSLRFRGLVVAVAAGLIIAGVVQVGKVKVDALPEFNPPMVEVQTEALGLSAAEVEQLITVPLEQDLLVGVAFLDEIESVSLPGLSSVVMTFEPGTDLLEARQVVQERLTQAVGVAGLPAVAKTPQMIQPLSSSSRVAMVKLSSTQLTPIEMSVLSRWVIGPRLMGVPGVANVAIWGNRERQLQVLVNPERLQENDVTLQQVINTAGNALEVSPLSYLEASKPGTGGFIDTINQRLNIFHEQVITSAEELAQVPLEGGDGGGVSATPPVTLGDVTSVVEDHQPLIGDAVCPGEEQCLLLVVERFPGANTLDVTGGIEDALNALRPGLQGLEMDSSVYRPATFVESSFAQHGWALLAGGLLLLLLIGGAFWSWRSSLVSVAAIAASAATAVLVLYLRGTTVDLMVAAGLVLGLTAVVWDAITDVSVLARSLQQSRREDSVPARHVIVGTVGQTRRSVAYAALIVAAAALPLLFTPAEGGAFLPPLALSYLLAVAASMLVALVLTPALGLLLLADAPLETRERPAVALLHRAYDRLAPGLLTRTRLAVVVCGLLALAGLVAVPFVDASMRPVLKERDLLVRLEAAPGTSLPRMTQLTQQAVADLEALPGVSSVGGQVGRAVMSDQDVNVNSGQLWVDVDPQADYQETRAAVRATVARYPDLSSDVTTYSADRVTDVLGRSDGDVVVRLYGQNADVLSTKADEVSGLVGSVEGISGVHVERAPIEQTMEIEVNLQQAQALGIKPGDVRRAAATLLGGITVGNLFEQQKVFDVVVWGAPELRQSETQIEQLRIDTPTGGQVQLGQVADVRVVPNPTVIRHESVAGYLDVTADVTGRSLTDVMSDIDDVLEQVQFPLEHHAEVLGDLQGRQAAENRVMALAVTALIAIFLLLQAAFGSWRLALGMFLLLLVALVGAVVAVAASGGALTLGSVGGLLAVLGLASRAVVALVQRYQVLKRAQDVEPHSDLVLRGTRDAVVPTVLSLLASAVVMLPVLVVGNVSGFEIVQPAAVAVLGGLVTTAIVVLFVVPALYMRFGDRIEPDGWSDEMLATLPAQRPEMGEQSPAAQAKRPQAGVLRRIRPGLAIPIFPGLLLTSCAGTVADAYVAEQKPAHVETIADSDLPRVVLTEDGARRIGLKTAPVEQTAGGLVVPSAAVFVDVTGSWWVYTNVEPLVFVRHAVSLVRDDAGQALLSSGPAPGTTVVTAGVPELAGVEADVGH